MMHSKSFITLLTVATIFGIAFAAPRPDEKPELSNEIVPGGFVTKNGNSVSASWGGFQASAALADDGSAVASAGGNGLGAGAGYGTGGVGASAGSAGTGVFGAGATSQTGFGSYGNEGKPIKQQQAGGSFFDRIFAIPINVLQSVNTYLNQKQQSQGQPGSVHGASASTSAGSHTYGGPETVSEGPGSADYGHQPAGTGEKGKRGTPMMIPITALKSVQNLLNG